MITQFLADHPRFTFLILLPGLYWFGGAFFPEYGV